MTKLTRDEIMKLQPGPVMAAWVADAMGTGVFPFDYPSYAEDLVAALVALDAFAEKHQCNYIIQRRHPCGMSNYCCIIEEGDLKYTDPETPDAYVGLADEKEMAICRAILLASNGA